MIKVVKEIKKQHENQENVGNEYNYNEGNYNNSGKKEQYDLGVRENEKLVETETVDFHEHHENHINENDNFSQLDKNSEYTNVFLENKRKNYDDKDNRNVLRYNNDITSIPIPHISNNNIISNNNNVTNVTTAMPRINSNINKRNSNFNNNNTKTLSTNKYSSKLLSNNASKINNNNNNVTHHNQKTFLELTEKMKVNYKLTNNKYNTNTNSNINNINNINNSKGKLPSNYSHHSLLKPIHNTSYQKYVKPINNNNINNNNNNNNNNGNSNNSYIKTQGNKNNLHTSTTTNNTNITNITDTTNNTNASNNTNITNVINSNDLFSQELRSLFSEEIQTLLYLKKQIFVSDKYFKLLNNHLTILQKTNSLSNISNISNNTTNSNSNKNFTPLLKHLLMSEIDSLKSISSLITKIKKDNLVREKSFQLILHLEELIKNSNKKDSTGNSDNNTIINNNINYNNYDINEKTKEDILQARNNFKHFSVLVIKNFMLFREQSAFDVMNGKFIFDKFKELLDAGLLQGVYNDINRVEKSLVNEVVGSSFISGVDDYNSNNSNVNNINNSSNNNLCSSFSKNGISSTDVEFLKHYSYLIKEGVLLDMLNIKNSISFNTTSGDNDTVYSKSNASNNKHIGIGNSNINTVSDRNNNIINKVSKLNSINNSKRHLSNSRINTNIAHNANTNNTNNANYSKDLSSNNLPDIYDNQSNYSSLKNRLNTRIQIDSKSNNNNNNNNINIKANNIHIRKNSKSVLKGDITNTSNTNTNTTTNNRETNKVITPITKKRIIANSINSNNNTNKILNSSNSKGKFVIKHQHNNSNINHINNNSNTNTNTNTNDNKDDVVEEVRKIKLLQKIRNNIPINNEVTSNAQDNNNQDKFAFNDLNNLIIESESNNNDANDNVSIMNRDNAKSKLDETILEQDMQNILNNNDEIININTGRLVNKLISVNNVNDGLNNEDKENKEQRQQKEDTDKQEVVKQIAYKEIKTKNSDINIANNSNIDKNNNHNNTGSEVVNNRITNDSIFNREDNKENKIESVIPPSEEPIKNIQNDNEHIKEEDKEPQLSKEQIDLLTPTFFTGELKQLKEEYINLLSNKELINQLSIFTFKENIEDYQQLTNPKIILLRDNILSSLRTLCIISFKEDTNNETYSLIINNLITKDYDNYDVILEKIIDFISSSLLFNDYIIELNYIKIEGKQQVNKEIKQHYDNKKFKWKNVVNDGDMRRIRMGKKNDKYQNRNEILRNYKNLLSSAFVDFNNEDELVIKNFFNLQLLSICNIQSKEEAYEDEINEIDFYKGISDYGFGVNKSLINENRNNRNDNDNSDVMFKIDTNKNEINKYFINQLISDVMAFEKMKFKEIKITSDNDEDDGNNIMKIKKFNGDGEFGNIVSGKQQKAARSITAYSRPENSDIISLIKDHALISNHSKFLETIRDHILLSSLFSIKFCNYSKFNVKNTMLINDNDNSFIYNRLVVDTIDVLVNEEYKGCEFYLLKNNNEDSTILLFSFNSNEKLKQTLSLDKSETSNDADNNNKNINEYLNQIQKNLTIKETFNDKTIYIPAFRTASFLIASPKTVCNSLSNVVICNNVKDEFVFTQVIQDKSISFNPDINYNFGINIPYNKEKDFIIKDDFVFCYINLGVLTELNVQTTYMTRVYKENFIKEKTK